MATNYRIGHHRKKSSFHIKGVLAITLLVIVLVGAGVYIISREQFKTDESPVLVSKVADPSKDYKVFSEKYFNISLPKDWQLLSSQVTPTIQFNYKSTKRFADNRTLTVYIDTVPPDFAVTHLQPVKANGNKLTLGSMSGRCSDFAGPGGQSTSLDNIQAKWEGVNFTCGLSYMDAYIVGTSSAESGINRVSLKGPTTGTHILFFAYDDQNISPDPSIFVSALNSFELK